MKDTPGEECHLCRRARVPDFSLYDEGASRATLPLLTGSSTPGAASTAPTSPTVSATAPSPTVPSTQRATPLRTPDPSASSDTHSQLTTVALATAAAFIESLIPFERGDTTPMKAVTSAGCTCYVDLMAEAARSKKSGLTVNDAVSSMKTSLEKRVGNRVRVHVAWMAEGSTARDKSGKVVETYARSSESALLDLEYQRGSWLVYWYGENNDRHCGTAVTASAFSRCHGLQALTSLPAGARNSRPATSNCQLPLRRAWRRTWAGRPSRLGFEDARGEASHLRRSVLCARAPDFRLYDESGVTPDTAATDRVAAVECVVNCSPLASGHCPFEH